MRYTQIERAMAARNGTQEEIVSLPAEEWRRRRREREGIPAKRMPLNWISPRQYELLPEEEKDLWKALQDPRDGHIFGYTLRSRILPPEELVDPRARLSGNDPLDPDRDFWWNASGCEMCRWLLYHEERLKDLPPGAVPHDCSCHPSRLFASMAQPKGQPFVDFDAALKRLIDFTDRFILKGTFMQAPMPVDRRVTPEEAQALWTEAQVAVPFLAQILTQGKKRGASPSERSAARSGTAAFTPWAQLIQQELGFFSHLPMALRRVKDAAAASEETALSAHDWVSAMLVVDAAAELQGLARRKQAETAAAGGAAASLLTLLFAFA